MTIAQKNVIDAQENKAESATCKTKRTYRKYTDTDKQNLFNLVFNEGMSTNASAIKLGMPPSTAYNWIKKEKEQRDLREADKETVKETNKETTQETTRETVIDTQRSTAEELYHIDSDELGEEYQNFLAEIIEEKLAIARAEIVKSVTAQFTDLNISKGNLKHFVNQKCKTSFDKIAVNNSPLRIEERYHWATYWNNQDMNFKKNCVFIDETNFHLKLTTMSEIDTMTPFTKTVYGAISNHGIVNLVNVLLKRTEQSLSKLGHTNDSIGHYFAFIKGTLDIMDQNKDIFENNYLVLERPFLLKDHPEIQRYIERRGFRCIILPSQSSELSPMKQFWSACKDNVRKETLITEETWGLKLKEASKKVTLSQVSNFFSNSVAKLDSCLDREPI